MFDRRSAFLPPSSPGAAAFTFFMLAVIVFSTFTFCVETLPQYYQHETDFGDKFFILFNRYSESR